MTEQDDKIKKLKEAADPLLKLLNQEYHPHCMVIVTPTSVEIFEGIIGIPKIED